jgi:hypothetical protein
VTWAAEVNRDTVGVAFETVSFDVYVLGALHGSPAYVAVRLSTPTGRFATVNDADPFTATAEPTRTRLTKNATGPPMAYPAVPPVMFAVIVTAWPDVEVVVERTTLVAVAGWGNVGQFPEIKPETVT